MLNQTFSEAVVTEIEQYSKLWEECMPAYLGLGFELQQNSDGWRTVITKKGKRGIVCRYAYDVIDFSQSSLTPDAGWNPKLLDSYAQFLKPALYFIASLDTIESIMSIVKGKSEKELTKPERKQLINLIRCGRFNIEMRKYNEMRFDGQTLFPLFYKQINKGRQPFQYKDTFAFYLKDFNFDSDDED